jgi:WD40 repeat protein
LYDLATGQKRGELIDGLVNANQLWVYGLAFSGDSRWLAAAYSDGLRVWDVAGQKVARRILRKETGAPLAFTPNGHSLACSGRDRVLFLDPLSGGEQKSFRLPRPKDPLFPDAVSFLALSADGQRLVTGGFRGGLRTWDVATGTPRVFREDGQPITALDSSPNGKFFVVGEQHGNVFVCDATGKVRWHKQFLQFGPATSTAAAFSADGRQLALAHPRRLEIWDVEKLVQATPEELAPVKAAAAADAPPAADGAHLISGFQAHSRDERTHWSGIWGLMVSPDDSALITVGMDKTARAWSLTSGQPIGQPLNLSGYPKMASIRPDGRALVIATQDAFNHKEEIYLRDLGPADWQDPLVALAKDGPGSRRLKDKGYFFAALAGDGKTLAVAEPRKCALLNWSDLSVRIAFPPHGFEIHFLAVSPDGNTVAVAGKQDPHVHLFNARTGKARQKLEAHRDGVRALAFSPDGKLLAATLANNRIATWDPEAGQVTGVVFRNAPRLAILGEGPLVFSPDSALLAAGGMADNGDGKAVLWETAAGKELTTFTYTSVTALAFSHDGRTLIAGGGDGYVNLWPIGAFRK